MSTAGERLAPYLYSTLLYASAPVVGPVLLARGLRSGKYLAVLPERLGLAGPALPAVAGCVWVHAVSVGEVLAARTLLQALAASGRGRFVLSSTTATGLALARQAAARGEALAAIASPLDFPGAVRRAFARVRPRALVLLEAELWPNWLRRAAREGVGAALVNARIGARSFRRYRCAAGLFRQLFAGLAAVGARAEEDAERVVALGADPARVAVTGDLKFDAPAPARPRPGARIELGLPAGGLVLIAGSVLAGEEAAVGAAFRALLARQPGAVLVYAPRKSFELPAALAGLKVVRRSERRPVPAGAVLLLDTLGELRDAYAAGDLAFVGGSLVRASGHNLLEPAAAGVPVLFGPSTESFQAVAERLLADGGGLRVGDADGLAATVVRLAGDASARLRAGERALAVVEAGRGAARRTVELLERTLFAPA